MRAWVIIPAWNEAAHVADVVRGILVALPGWSVVVVDDCSTDNTVGQARTAGAVVLCHPVNRGQGAALQTGTDYALAQGAEIIVHCDADGQHKPNEIAAWIKPIQAGTADIVFGSRWLTASRHLPWSKRLAFRILIPWHNLFTGLPLTDLHNGARAMNRTAAERIRITYDGMAHNSDIVSQTAVYGLRWQEVPTEVLYNEYGQGLRGAVKIVKDLAKRALFG